MLNKKVEKENKTGENNKETKFISPKMDELGNGVCPKSPILKFKPIWERKSQPVCGM